MTKLLSREQVNQYHNSGFVSPVDVLTQDEIQQSINEIENIIGRTWPTLGHVRSSDRLRF